MPGFGQLALPRLLNLMVNPFAVLEPNINLQKQIFRRGGQGSAYGDMTGGFPTWLVADLSVGAFKTSRGHFPLPTNFYLLAYLASASVNNAGGFRGVLYDTTRRMPLTMRPCNFNTLAGVGSSPLFAGVPYTADPTVSEPKIKYTVYNLENATNLIQFALFGLQLSN